MACKRILITSVVSLALAGCATLNPQSQIEEVSNLVDRRVGLRPDWLDGWDDRAPDWSAETVLTLDEALSLALRNNRELHADLEMIGTANADLVQAGLLQNPVFNFMFMFPDGGGRAMLRSGALPMQPLQDLWLIPARKDVAAAALQSAVLRVADRAITLAAEVKKAYARLGALQTAIELISANLLVVEQSTGILRTRQAAAQSTQVEVNVSYVRELRLRSDLLSTRAEYQTMQREFLELLGLAIAGDQWRVQPIDASDVLPEPSADEAQLLALGLEQRLDLKAAEWIVDASADRIRLARREGWPELALGLTLERPPAARTRAVGVPGRVGNRLAQGMVDRLTGTSSGPMVTTVEPFRVVQPEIDSMIGPMIEMEIPIFDQNQAQIAKAAHEFRRSVAEYEARVQAAARMIREALVRHRERFEQARLFRESITPEVERNLELAQQSFIAGHEDLTVFLLAQEDLIATRLKLLDFYRDYFVTRAELERAVGGRLDPLPEIAARPIPGNRNPAVAGNEVYHD